jgi:hypothetical protein
MLVSSLDTPVHRASIREITLDEAEKLIELMRERRMKLHNAYEEAMAAKAKIKEERDKARYEQVLKMFDKKMESTTKGLDTLSKYVAELRVLQMVAGD